MQRVTALGVASPLPLAGVWCGKEQLHQEDPWAPWECQEGATALQGLLLTITHCLSLWPPRPACLTCACCSHSTFVKDTSNSGLKGPQGFIVTRMLAGRHARIPYLREVQSPPSHFCGSLAFLLLLRSHCPPLLGSYSPLCVFLLLQECSIQTPHGRFSSSSLWWWL